MSAFFGIPDSVLSAVVVGLLAIPSTLLTYRAGMKKQADDKDAQFDARMLAALEQRDKVIESQNGRIQAMQESQSTLHERMGELRAELAALTRSREERDARERTQLAEMAAMKERLTHLDTCAGGQPCPLAKLRSH